MRVMWQQPPRWIKNPYLLLGLSFLLWMLFFDADDLVTQYRLRKKLSNLEAEKTYYLEQIAEIQQQRKGLEVDEDLLERFAREKYFMKKKTEDLYIIVDE
jgi:cell division protein DivIC